MMRKQYSLRRSAGGFDAWDVDRLVELAVGLPVREVAVADIAELDEEYWFADSEVPATVHAVVEHARLIAEVDVAHPIILDVHGRVMDGMHRVARALLDGRATSPRCASRCSHHRTSSTAVRASSRTTVDGGEGARVPSSGTR